MRSLTLIPATTKDLDRIMDLEAKGFSDHLQEAREVYANRITTFPQGSLMAYKNDTCVGCLFSEIWNYHPAPSADYFALNHSIDNRHDLDGNEVYINSMTINPDYRGQGIGRELFTNALNYFAQHFAQIKSAILLVNEHWTSAKTIYEQSGFKHLMTLDNFFGAEPEKANGIVMRKYL